MRLIRRILAILALGPIALWLLCIAFVMLLGFGFGCEINEGFANPCVVLGRDLSETAYSMGILAAWGPLIFGPVSMGAGFLWAIAVAIDRHRSRPRQ
ncbi:hypothetical protein K3555_13435 [Leisingera sp. M527]|uniref:hypothetical protein n=1 Tax=unclassified Leisingera TaxID=2614906 RepID=UPI0021A4A01B|nr:MULTISPECIES: hypothetical protein [unclassified Leisingera]UWQ27533.1 hypothetical protein K3557_11995 [Leisingera sp. M523]UWQ31596.1 hypothetical protein K3555_13435 [Leisingera sp. M527]UWQ73587.1 hypothetical protein K3724_13625 [Leisingera sp. M658]